jgi:hypothetical protein
VEKLWRASRSGSHAGRGFRYQDAVAAELAVRAWAGELTTRRLVPEGLDDISVELADGWLHLQAKSRREHRGDFALADLDEVWAGLAARLALDPGARAAVLLERPAGALVSGLDRSLVDVADSQARGRIAAALDGSGVGIEDFLARSHVVVMPGAPSVALALLASRLELPPASCVAHLAILRSRLGELADANGTRAADDPAAASVADIARLIDDVSEAVDPSALDEAVRSGACEIVDFATPRHDDRFYGGIDVTVGHVVAGLPASRPVEVSALVGGLSTAGVAMAVGPSGSGKSALVWMSAHATRHDTLWYRVRRLGVEDVVTVVRLAKALLPGSGLTVGFVVDDVGGDDRAGFDALVRELRLHDGAVVLAACREEDLVLVRTATEAAQVRPRLDEALAERLWRELHERGETDWDAWREPYERANGLLLEYGHVLTQGRRLEDTVGAQVDRRVLEGRVAELAVLAPVALGSAFGAGVDVLRLTEGLDLSAGDVKSALVRLAEEHLVTERDGLLRGLHELRSRAITVAIHRVPPPVLAGTVEQVVGLLDARALYLFLTRLLRSGLVSEDVIVEAVVTRLSVGLEPAVLGAALQALRVAAFEDIAQAWAQIAKEEGVGPTSAGTIAWLVLADTDTDMLPEARARAAERMRATPVPDERGALLEWVGDDVAAIVTGVDEIDTAVTVLSALAETGVEIAVAAEPLAAVARDADLASVRLLLDAAYGVSPSLAATVVTELGGEAALLARVEDELPWVRGARLDVDEGGRPAVRADYVYVSPSSQSEPHDTVVDLARTLRALAPSTEVALCRAVDAAGRPAGFRDFVHADKRLARDALPSHFEVAWNRARSRAVMSAVAAESATEYQAAARDLIEATAKAARRLGERWVRGHAPGTVLAQELDRLIAASNALRPEPVAVEPDLPFDLGELPEPEPTSGLADMVAGTLAISLFRGSNVAPLVAHLLPVIDKLAEPARWRLIDPAPDSALRALRGVLTDIQAVVAEVSAADGEATAVALRREGRRGLPSAAAHARRAAGRRLEGMLGNAERTLRGEGYEVDVVAVDREPDGVRWPSKDAVVLLSSASMFDWPSALDSLVALCVAVLEPPFLIVPVRDGSVVTSRAVHVFGADNVLPTTDLVSVAGELPLPALEETAGEAFVAAVDALVEVSSIFATLRPEGIHPIEEAAISEASVRADERLTAFGELLADGPVLVDVADVLDGMASTVNREIESFNAGKGGGRSIAVSMLEGAAGSIDDVFVDVWLGTAACLEHDVDPEGAVSLLRAALEPARDE